MLSLVFVLLFGASCGYQILATILCGEFGRRKSKQPNTSLRFSQVKPLRRMSDSTLRCVETFLEAGREFAHDFYICSPQKAPDEWMDKWPGVTWLRLQADQSQNGKAATLALGEKYWSGDIFIVSDADMMCPPDYLEAVLGEFVDPEVGVVTCLYRGAAEPGASAGALLESLSVLDFSVSILVAERTEGIAFAMGSTMAIRREVLEAIGGFESLKSYLADDFQLGHRAVRKGWKVALAPTVLDTQLGAPSLREALVHQHRWLVTSRVSRPKGHVAFLLTQGLFWSLLLVASNSELGFALLGFWCFLRVGLGVMQSLSLKGVTNMASWKMVFLPLKDFIYIFQWCASLWSNRVRWGDSTIVVDSKGAISKEPFHESGLSSTAVRDRR